MNLRVGKEDLELGVLRRRTDLQDPQDPRAPREHGDMAGQPRPQQAGAAGDQVLFDDVPLPAEPLPVRDQPLRDPLRDQMSQSYPGAAYGNHGFADDVGFEDDDLPERRSLGGPMGSPPDYGNVGRAPLPISTISPRLDVPFSGLHLLSGLEAVEIQQTVELDDLLSSIESENRYLVKSARGETLLVAAETSPQWQRQCVGSSRALRMRVYDPSRQESLHLSRRLACGGGPCGLLGCCCYMQRVDVLLPPGRPLGAVTQAWSWLAPELLVRDSAGNVLYRVVGPVMRPWDCAAVREAVFKITSRDGLVELGGISHQWKSSASSLVTRVIFPSAELNVHHKALIMSAAFLLEYMYFESAKKRSWLPCC